MEKRGKMTFLKTKAIFMTFIIVFSIFSIYLIKPVKAEEQKVCCERTKSGDFCQYTEKINCNDSSKYKKDAVTCDQTSYCRNICCVDDNTGACSKQVPAALCKNRQNSTIVNDKNCNVELCNKGCCILGSQCKLSTEASCEIQANKYPVLDKSEIFNSGITSEFECLSECRQEDQGCCVNEETCSFTSRNNCETSGEEGSGGIGFYKGIYCSDSRMSCECRPKFKKGCVEGEEDVFWFDSCGNREGIANDCDYSKGNMCGEVNGDFACKNVDCKDTLDYENNLEHDPRMGGERKNGESWCVYEGRVGPSYDLVGSRHYRHICLNGEELIEPCMDFRGEICLQSSFDDEEFSSAVCLQNQGLECVTECSDGDNEENKKCCKDKSTCVWTADEKDNGVCMPLIPPGLAFWPNAEGRGPSVDAKDICDYGDQKCKSVWEKKIDGWECEVNCDCEKEKWVDDVNNFCRSLGDCGAYYNMNGDLTIDGQSTSGSKTKDLDIKLIEDFSFLKQAGKILLFESNKTYEEYLDESAGFDYFEYLSDIFNNPGWIVLGVAAAIITVPYVVIGYFIFSLAGIGDTKIYVHNFNCEPWVAPEGGDSCEKCNEDGFECSEYKCKSLGSMCKLLNEGSKNEKCVSVSPNDVNSPLIEPWNEILDKKYSIDKTASGYYVRPDVKPFERFTFGIKLNEPAWCNFDEKHTSSFEEMENIFGNSIYEAQKNVTLMVRGGEDYTYYIRCKDANGNKNIKEYTIQFSSEQEDDITPPIIESTSIENGAYVRYGTNETLLTIYLNEPSLCKWSKDDKSLSEMENGFICNNDIEGERTFFGLFECLGGLNGIKDEGESKFYFKCKDLNGNENQDSYEFILIGTNPLEIDSVNPSGELHQTSVELLVSTKGGAENGKAICSFGENFADTEFFVTGDILHKQQLTDLNFGDYNFNIECKDIAGNIDEDEISFSISVDSKGPKVVYIFSEDGILHLITDEDSRCEFSNDNRNFLFGDGVEMDSGLNKEHTTTIKNDVYYVKCEDSEGNLMDALTVYS